MTQTGPRSRQAKAAVRRNALKHGIRSEITAVAGFEDESEWEAHRDGIIESLQPEGHREHSLTERIAIALWQLHRLDQHQATLTLKHIAGAEADLLRQRSEVDMLLHRPPSTEDISKEDILRAQLVRSFPPPDEMALILRYETHYHRLLIQTLHELEAVQTRRKSGNSPFARLDITGAPGG